MVYRGENAIEKVRGIAALRPEEADSTSIRGAYGRITTKASLKTDTRLLQPHRFRARNQAVVQALRNRRKHLPTKKAVVEKQKKPPGRSLEPTHFIGLSAHNLEPSDL